MPTNKNMSSGFTLIELCIVLVIIGLIVGGVLVGRDLVKASEIQATIGQYEKFNIAVNTFKLKYDGLPGDLRSTDALAFGLFCLGGTPATCTGGTGMGDGNSLISSVGTTSVAQQALGEPLVFWRQLSDAEMIDGFSVVRSAIDQASGESTDGNMSSYFPSGKINNNTYWMVGGNLGVNYYLLTTARMVPGFEAQTKASGGISPNEAYIIDSKIDDGMPNTGNVQARGTSIWAYTLFMALSNGGGIFNYGVNHLEGSEAAGDCIVTPASVGVASPLSPLNNYSRASVSGNVQACGLRFKFQ